MVTTRLPSCAYFARAPPAPIKWSSLCAAIARMVSGIEGDERVLFLNVWDGLW